MKEDYVKLPFNALTIDQKMSVLGTCQNSLKNFNPSTATKDQKDLHKDCVHLIYSDWPAHITYKTLKH